MKIKSIIILIILFAGLVLLSYLAPKLQEGLIGQTDAENQAEAERKSAAAKLINSKNDYKQTDTNAVGSDKLQTGTSLYGPNGEICQVLVNQYNKQYLEVRDSIIKPPVYYNYDLNNTDKFTGPNNSYARVDFGTDNQPRISIYDSNGNVKVFANDGTHSNNNPTNNTQTNYTHTNYTNTNSTISTNNYNSPSSFSSSLPRGIPEDRIVPGTEDLYILKSQIVPQYNTIPSCKPCSKKKHNPDNSPYPVFSDYTSFGM
jgi:hypothetical protein